MDQTFRVVAISQTGQVVINAAFPANLPGMNTPVAERFANATYDAYAYKPDMVYVAMFSPYNQSAPSRQYSRGW